MVRVRLRRLLKYSGVFIGCFIVTIMFFLNLVLPLFSKQELGVSDDGLVLGDESPVEPEAYIYETFTPHVNSFGIGNTTFKTVNWSHFKTLFNDHFYKDAMYKRYEYSDWVNGNEYVGIDKTWNDDGYWKINITLDVPVDIYEINVSFGCDLPVLQYIEREGFEIWLNYTANNTETYQVYFNWSDIAGIPGLSITTHKEDGIFWISMHRNNVPEGYYVFDPTFGNTGSYVSTVNLENSICGGCYTMGATAGTANNITIYLTDVASTSQKVTCGIYTYIDRSSSYAGTLVGQTEVRSFQNTGAGLKTFDFVVEPSLTAGTTYYLMASAQDVLSGGNFGSSGSGGTTDIYKSVTYSDTLVSPLTGEATSGYKRIIYCSYTESGGGEALPPDTPTDFQYENPVNGSTGQALSFTWSVNCNDSEGDTVDSSIQCLGFTDTFSSQNETLSLSLSGLTYNTAYTVYCYANDTNNFTQEQFTFTTLSEPVWNNKQYIYGNYTNITSFFIQGYIYGNYTNTTTWYNKQRIYGNYTNITSWNNQQYIYGNYTNTTTWNKIQNIYGNYTNGSYWNNKGYIYGNYTNTTGWINQQYIYGNYTNITTWNNIQQIYGNYTNNTIWYNQQYIYGNYTNGSEWNNKQQIYGNYTNTTTWYNKHYIYGNYTNESIDWNNEGYIYGNYTNNTIWYNQQYIYGNYTNGTGAGFPIIINNIYPSNNSYNIPLQPTMYLTINHTNGQTMNLSWYYGTLDNENILLSTETNITNSTQSELNYNASSMSTDYYWRIQIDDENNYANYTYRFKTEGWGGGYSYQPTSNSLWAIGILGTIGFLLIFVIIKKRKNKEDDF